jgi:Lysozyme like domain
MAQTYSFNQLETLWTNAGGNPSVAPQMAAIAIAESSGNPVATNNDSDGTTDYGLWQINSIHGFNSAGLTSNPAYNAEAAVAVYNSQGFGAWSTYGNSNYETALSENGYAALGNVSGGASTMTTPVAPPTPLTNVLTGTFGEYGAWITNNNVNVLYKAIFLCLGLLVFAAIPLTNKFAGYAAFGILFLLIIQEPDPNPNPVSLFNSGTVQGGI